MILGLDFYSEDPDGVGGAINIFFFPDLFTSAGPETDLLAYPWVTTLGKGGLTSFTDMILMLTNKKVVPVASWEYG